jgi:hypothetical protein
MTAADKVDEFNLVAFVHDNFIERAPFEHDEVMLDGDAARVDREPGK